MGGFKRFCMIVFVVASTLGVGVLAALWFAWEPLLPAIAWLADMPWFYVAEAVLLGITALGLLIILIDALSKPGKKSHLRLERDGGSHNRHAKRHPVHGPSRGGRASRMKTESVKVSSQANATRA